MEMIEIDGAFGEGGGAVLRTAVGLSAITGKPVRIFNIRKGRREPGLRPQHLEGVSAVSELCNGLLKGASIGSTEIEFYPGKLVSKNIEIKIGTAGSVGLVFQSLKLLACRIEKPLEITISGGATFGKFAPPVLYTKNVLLPTLERMGYKAEIEIIRHGFYPVGGSKVRIKIHPCRELKPLVLPERAEIEKIHGLSIASKHLEKPNVAYRQANEAEKLLENYDTNIKIEYVDSDCPGSGIVLWSRDYKGNILGSDGLGEKGIPAEKVGREAANSMIRAINSQANVDEHLTDQLLVFMALTNGKSSITTPKITEHSKTNIWVIKEFIPTDFEIKERKNNSILECKGTI